MCRRVSDGGRSELATLVPKARGLFSKRILTASGAGGGERRRLAVRPRLDAAGGGDGEGERDEGTEKGDMGDGVRWCWRLWCLCVGEWAECGRTGEGERERWREECAWERWG